MTKEIRRTSLIPATINEAEAIDVVAHWIDLVAAVLGTEAAHIVLRDYIRAKVRSGAISTMKIIDAARAGHADADRALRELGVEMLDQGQMPPAALRVYLEEALVQSPVSFPAGRNVADTWLRDIAVAVLVTMAAERWNLKPTRNRAAKKPSACSVVAAALNRRGHSIGERQVERIFADHGGPNGPAQRLSATLALD